MHIQTNVLKKAEHLQELFMQKLRSDYELWSIDLFMKSMLNYWLRWGDVNAGLCKFNFWIVSWIFYRNNTLVNLCNNNIKEQNHFWKLLKIKHIIITSPYREQSWRHLFVQFEIPHSICLKPLSTIKQTLVKSRKCHFPLSESTVAFHFLLTEY